MDLPETTDQTLRLIAIGEDGASKEPLELSDAAREVGQAMCQMYQAQGFAPPWIGYLAQEDGAVVGTCAFKGPPQDRRVEIAYFTFPEHEGRGIATEMARQLVALGPPGGTRHNRGGANASGGECLYYGSPQAGISEYRPA
jgi:hypothetical protein